MDKQPWLRLFDSLRGRLEFEVSLAPLTTFGVGGPAAILACPESLEELADIFEVSCGEGLPHIILGGGSNILFADEGFAGLVVKLGRSFGSVERTGDSGLKAGAAALSSYVLKRAVESGLSGLECLAGIPGTIGGAAMMNAGSYGQDLGSAVKSITWYGPDGSWHISPKADLEFSYRQLRKKTRSEPMIILELELSLIPDSPENIKSRIKESMGKREATQPRKAFTAGSVFKNPEGQSAGRLIEECSLKGTRVGGAVVSEKHANFIVNEGQASSSDIRNLMEIIIRTVDSQYGLTLKPEIKIISPQGEMGFL